MAISPEAIAESISKLNKCVITNGKILEIKPKKLDDCENMLDIIVKGKEGYYDIKTTTMIKQTSKDCPMESLYNGNNYKSDIGKEKNLLINRDGLYVVDLEKNHNLDLLKELPPTITIKGYGLSTSNDYFIKQFPNTEICKPNLTTKEYYYNYLLPDIKKDILKSNHTIYYFGTLLIIVLGIIGILVYRKFKKTKKQG